MLYWLFNDYFAHEARTLRMGGAAVLSFLLVILLGPAMIRWLIRKKVGDKPEFDHMTLNELTKGKVNTPTMGGILIVLAIFVSVLLFADLQNMYIRMALLALLWLGTLGGIDDWLKLRKLRKVESKGGDKDGKGDRHGLHMWEKILFQIGLAVLLSHFMYEYGDQSSVPILRGDNAQAEIASPAHRFYIPFIVAPFVVGALAHAVITVLTVVGASNAVNLSDGMDGLCSGCMILVTLVFLVVSLVVGLGQWSAALSMQFVPESLEMTILCCAMIGACLGFLWYNTHPAQVFMGDTGSLTLGGLIGFIAVVVRQEALLLIAGGVFVIEALSVIMQVSVYKATKGRNGLKGKRLFRCAPLHHHFHLGGWAETKVVGRFWILGAIFAATALAMLKWKV